MLHFNSPRCTLTLPSHIREKCAHSCNCFPILPVIKYLVESVPVLSFQDVVSHSKKLTKKNKEQLSDMMMLNKQRGGLKALSKEKREKLEAYQHLFYLLQVSSF